MTALLALVVALVPLLIAPHLLFFFDVTPKIALLLLGTAAVLPGFRPRALLGSRESRWLLALLALAGVSLAFSTALSTRPELSVYGTGWRRYGLLTGTALLLFIATLAGHLAGRPERLRAMLRVIALAGVPVALYGILQYFGWDPWLPKEGYHIGEGYWTIVRPPSTLGYVSYFANYLLYVVFAGAALQLREETRAWRVAGLSSATLAAIAIVFSGTRAAMLGIAGGFFLLVFWLRPRFSKTAGRVMAGVFASGVLFYYSPAGQPLRSRTRWYIEDPKGGPRLWLWRDSFRMGAHYWKVGSGPETFSSTFPHFQSDELSRQFPDFYHESAHNMFLDALTSQGVLGLAVALAFTSLGFVAAWRARAADRRIAAPLAAAVAAALFSQQFTVFILPTALFFYLTIALLVAQVTPPPPDRSPRPALAAIPISALLAFFALRLLAADRALFQAKLAIEAGHLVAAQSAYERAANRGIPADLWYSRAMALAATRAPDPSTAIHATQQALAAAVRATHTAEDPQNAWYHLATLYGRLNDPLHTEQSLREAIAASPDWFKPHWMLAQVLLLTSRRDEALHEATIAARLNGGKNPEVDRTLAQLQADSPQPIQPRP